MYLTAPIQRAVARLSDTSRKLILGIATFVVCEIGARISAPHLNGHVLGDWLRRTEQGGLLALYDRLVGGAISRGAVLALGIMPYLSARIFMRIARALNPAIGAMHRDAAGRQKLTHATRWLTFGLSLVQSYGFARFALGVPGAVTDPGVGFIAETMVVLTGGALVVMTLVEQFADVPSDVVGDNSAMPQSTRDAASDADESGAVSSHPPVLLLTAETDAVTDVVLDQSAVRTRVER